jgi:hypothetical protein
LRAAFGAHACHGFTRDGVASRAGPPDQWQDVAMPGAPGTSRRSVLIGAAALAALGATACAGGSPKLPEPDELEAQLELARRDSQLARAAATAAGAFYAPLLNVVADERADHAKALSAEIARASGATITPAGPPVPSPSAAATPPARTDVMAALRESADSAAKLAANLSRYRAGLLGSIAASCTASATVPLAVKEPAH